MRLPPPVFIVAMAAICLSSNAFAADESTDKTDLYTGKEYSSAFANPKDDPDLPNVLLIGDSISIGYTVEVRRRLRGQADVFRIPVNGKFSAYGLEQLDTWIGERGWDVIHFNWGLWDLCYRRPAAGSPGNLDKVNGVLTTTPEQYRANLNKIMARLKETNATLIWCATTPVPIGEPGRKVGDDIRYNRIAEQVMKEHEVRMNDLHTHALLKLPGIEIRKGNVHFTEDGYEYLAEKVASEISAAL